MKKSWLRMVLCFILSGVILAGCTTQEFTKPEQLPKAIEWIDGTTDKAIATKDLKSARLLWSKISEYGIKAGDAGYKELGKDLGALASTYINLINYLETNDGKQLVIFEKVYLEAIEELKNSVLTN